MNKEQKVEMKITAEVQLGNAKHYISMVKGCGVFDKGTITDERLATAISMIEKAIGEIEHHN